MAIPSSLTPASNKHLKVSMMPEQLPKVKLNTDAQPAKSLARKRKQRYQHHTMSTMSLVTHRGNPMKRQIVLCLLLGSAQALLAEQARPSGHDETLYGTRLTYRKLDDVGPCIATEVVGNRLSKIRILRASGPTDKSSPPRFKATSLGSHAARQAFRP